MTNEEQKSKLIMISTHIKVQKLYANALVCPRRGEPPCAHAVGLDVERVGGRADEGAGRAELAEIDGSGGGRYQVLLGAEGAL